MLEVGKIREDKLLRRMQVQDVERCRRAFPFLYEMLQQTPQHRRPERVVQVEEDGALRQTEIEGIALKDARGAKPVPCRAPGLEISLSCCCQSRMELKSHDLTEAKLRGHEHGSAFATADIHKRVPRKIG